MTSHASNRYVNIFQSHSSPSPLFLLLDLELPLSLLLPDSGRHQISPLHVVVSVFEEIPFRNQRTHIANEFVAQLHLHVHRFVLVLAETISDTGLFPLLLKELLKEEMRGKD